MIINPGRALVLAERPVLPATDGAQLRIASILQALAPIEVDFVHLHEPGQEFLPVECEFTHCRTLAAIAHRNPLTNRSRLRSVFSLLPNGTFRNRSESMRKVLTNIRAEEYDFVLICGIHMLQYATCIAVRPLFVDMCDSEPRHMKVRQDFVRDPVRKAYFRWQHYKVLRHIGAMANLCDKWFTISEVERRSLLSYFPDAPVDVIPNAVVDLADRSEIKTRDKLIVLSGNFDFFPNVDAALFFARAVMPLITRQVQGCSLRLLGKNPPDAICALKCDTIEVTGFVANFVASLSEAAVYVCSLRLGTGVKNKVLEAMAAGIPVISTPVGVDGVDVKAGTHYLEALTAGEFADAVLLLLSDPELHQSLARAARATVLEQFGQKTVSAALYRSISRTHSTVAPVAELAGPYVDL
jgi:glycosyltransferase involved in cell wall biosynthesis